MDAGGFERQSARRRMVRRGLVAAGTGVLVATLVWAVAVVGIDTLVEKILNLPTWLVVALVFLLPALEASAFVGIVFPGEIAVLLGGVVASNGRVPLAAVLVSASLGAAIGDQVGYLIGREWGQQLLRRLPDRLLDEDRLQRGRAYIRRLGAKGVVLGRWTAALRALVPGLAGVARMRYARFLVANVVGGTFWAITVALIGYGAGNRWRSVKSTIGDLSYLLLGLVVAAALAAHLVRRRREHGRAVSGPDQPDAADAPQQEPEWVDASATNPPTITDA